MKKKIRLLLLTIIILLIAIAGYQAFDFAYGCYQDASEIASKSTKSDFIPDQTGYIYASDGSVLAKLSNGSSSIYLAYEQIPATVENAFVSIEDRSFWTNHGYDLKGILRSAWRYIKSGGDVVQGGSTITQQTCKLVYLDNSKTVSRKTTEIFLAAMLAEQYSKEDIIEFYINNCCFANGIYGIKSASEIYFGCSPEELTLSQTAYLCAIPNSPEAFDPYEDPSAALTRRDLILDAMQSEGYITEKECWQAKKEEITIMEPQQNTVSDYASSYAIDCAARCLMENEGFEFRYSYESMDDYYAYKDSYDEMYSYEVKKLYTKGYRIYTTIDPNIQNSMQSILDNNLSVFAEPGSDGNYAVQGSMTVIDNGTGKVIAVIGGRNPGNAGNTLNRAYQAYRQPGSTIKPLIIYAPALELGYSKYSTLKDIDVQYAYSHPNTIDSQGGTRMSLQNAVANSRNGCAVGLFHSITPSAGLSKLAQMKYKKIVPDDFNLSAALGGLTYGTNTTEMAAGYHALANHGVYTEATCIQSILDGNGTEIYHQDEGTQVYTRVAADEMTDVMTNTLKYGTASGLRWSRSTSIPAAGKTGTTNSTKDGWFCGYTPYYTVSVWVGRDDNQEVPGLYGANYPGSIWRDAMLTLINGREYCGFDLQY